MNLATLRSAALVAVASVLLLSGCTLGSSPGPTAEAQAPETTAPAPSPSPEAVDPLTTVTEIVVRPVQLDLLDVDGALVTTLSFDDETTAFVDALSIALGEEPQQTEREGGLETAPWTQYAWTGLEVHDDHENQVPTNGGGVYGSYELNVSVVFTAPAVGDGVAVRTIGGFQPGGDAETLAAELGEPWYGNGQDQVRVETGEPIGEQQPGNPYENAYSVTVNTWELEGATAWITAPWNFGVGHV
ncbi:hypothetical protein [Agromyces allii]|uniref:hypothetical protein n=1 Tax=Agromyces allii TaxID=393607 RepID=UPI0012F7B7C5|nr:hypothetical protein [Agromyces allii]